MLRLTGDSWPVVFLMAGCGRLLAVPPSRSSWLRCGRSSPGHYVTQAERPAIQRAAALLPDSEYTAHLAAGRSQAIDDALTAALPILQDRQPVATR